MKQPTAAVFFDLDGTLVDTAPDFIRVLTKYAQRKVYHPCLDQ